MNRDELVPCAFVRAFAVLLLLALPAAVAEYISARDVAQRHGLVYHDIGVGAVHACKLVGNGHEVLLSADVPNILIDGASTVLPRPIKWEGDALHVPTEGAELLARRLGGGAQVLRPVVEPPEKKPRRTFKVVLDPGHGGKDPGAVRAGVKEKDINLDVAQRLAPLLKAQGVSVVWTRRADVGMSLSERVAVGNRARPDLFLSIHANTEPTNRTRGAMTMYPAESKAGHKPDLEGRAKQAVDAKSFSPRALEAGGNVGRQAMLAAASAAFEGYRIQSIRAAEKLQTRLEPVTGTLERENGVIEDWQGLHLLSYVQAPVVLVEVDFMSNAASLRKLRTASYRAKIAAALSRGVTDFLDELAEEDQ